MHIVQLLSWVLRRRRGDAGAESTPARAATPAVRAPQSCPPAAAGPVTEAFGPYRLIEKIGEGGMAEIWTALTPDGHDPLVIKRLRAELCENPVAVAHFREEGELVRGLRHPNIAGVRDFGVVDGRHYIAGEYVAGRDLGRVTRFMVKGKQRPLSARAICYVAHEVLCGLEYAHHRVDASGRPLDLVHRDITPENVMVTLDGEVKLLDFGIARADGCPDAEGEGVKGNVDFMSPEQARGQRVDRRGDLFSLGMVMYFCAARAPLYRGKTIYDRLIAAATGPGASEEDFLAGLPPPLPDILPRALRVEPSRRFQTAAEMRAVLAPHADGGAAELAGLMQRLYGEEVLGESDRIFGVSRVDRTIDDLPAVSFGGEDPDAAGDAYRDSFPPSLRRSSTR
jgi:serine/threonine protein kinase